MANGSCSADLEDIQPNDVIPVDEVDKRSTSKASNAAPPDEETRTLSHLSTLPSGIPGSHFVYVKTWGCSHNWSDSEYMAGILSNNGYKVTFNDEESADADIWVLNSCTVKGRAQNLFESALKKAKSLNKYVVTAGCVPSGDKKNTLWSDVSIIGVQQIDQIDYVVQQTLNGNVVQLLKNKKTTDHEHHDAHHETEQESKATKKRKAGGAPLSMPKLRRNKYEEIVPINTGCLNQCTYCKTKHARGDLGSYTVQEIIDRIREVLKEGVRIINLESEDTGAYGLDIGTNIAELLQEIERQILNDPVLSRNMMLRLGISNPPYFLSHAPKVAKLLRHPRVFQYIHIPVQSGSNRVLYDMKRKYTIQEFDKLCQIMVDELKDVHLCTDIIAGFPTETDECWKKTVELVKKWKFTTLFISPFFPRPGTPAARFDYVYGDNQRVDVDRIKKERVKELTAVFQQFEPYQKRVNTKQFWLCDKGKAKDGVHFVGLNKFAEKILVKPLGDIDLTGKILEVDVFDCGKKYMYARVCKEYGELLREYPDEVNYIELRKELGLDTQIKVNKFPKNAKTFVFNKLYALTVFVVAMLAVLLMIK